MGDVVSFPISLDSDLGRQLVADCCKFQEKILTEQQVRKKYQFDEAAWEALSNDEMVRAVSEESIRRIRDGSSKREKSQLLVTKAPDVAASIMLNDSANDRHRLDACKVLNDLSANGPAAAAGQSDRFVISIILNSDDGGAPHTLHFDKSTKPDGADGAGGEPTTLHFDKSRAVNVDDSGSNDIDATPWGMFPAIAAKKPQGGGDGQPI